MERLLSYAYRRLGPRYPRAALLVQFQLAHLVVLGGLGLLTLYEDAARDEFWRLFAVAEGLVLLENALALWVVSRLLRPAEPWLRGERTVEAAREAWVALARLPLRFLTYLRSVPVLFNIVPVSVYITLELGLPWSSVLVLAAGSAIVLLYGAFLRFFGMELILRPVLAEVSQGLPAELQTPQGGVPLRWRLLIALPVINIVTGVVVSGLSTGGDSADLSDLGFDVLVALAVTFTLSLELTLLLARSIVTPVERLRAATERVASGDLAVRVPVVSEDETGRLTASFNHMVSGLAERERLREAFEAYVDPDVAARVAEEGAVLAGEEVEVSVLFLDIRDFTRFAERASAREVVAELNAFYDRVVPVLHRHGGHANKFVGDGLLGIFGAPDPLTDHADRAVLAALDILREVRDAYGGRLRLGIGINSGTVVAGTVGGGGRVEFTVIGDAVNTAARVEEATRVTGDDLLITEATRRRLELPFGGWIERPRVALKGKTERVRLHAPALREDAEATAQLAQPRFTASAADLFPPDPGTARGPGSLEPGPR